MPLLSIWLMIFGPWFIPGAPKREQKEDDE